MGQRGYTLLIILFVVGLIMPRSVEAKGIETISFTSDSSWKASNEFVEGWEAVEFDDSGWELSIAPTAGLCRLGNHKPAFTSPMWTTQPINQGTAYFRKTFYVDGVALEADIKAAFDDDGEVFVNGVSVVQDYTGRTERDALEVDITEFVTPGLNVVALKAVDSFGGCQWAQALAEVKIEVVDDEKLNVPLFRQSHPEWADNEYDSGNEQQLWCGSTIEQCGCVTSSLAMLLSYYGISFAPNGQETNPATLNEYFNQDAACTEHGCISKGYAYGNVRWNAINSYSAEAFKKHGSQKIMFNGGTLFDKDRIKNDILDGHPVIGKDDDISHWFVITGIDSTDEKEDDTKVHVNDPYFDRATAGVSKTRHYKKVNSDFSLIEVFAPGYVDVRLYNASGDEVPLQVEFEESYSPSDSSLSQENSDDSIDKAVQGVTWAYIQQPQSGAYTITAHDHKGEFAVFVSDKNGKEAFTLVEQNNIYLDFDKENVSNTSFTTKNACELQTKEYVIKSVQETDVDRDGINDIIFYMQ